MYCNIFDSHTHSENSHDGRHSVTFMAETAISKNLQGISITDHCDGEDFEENAYASRMQQSAISTAKAKYAFGDRLIITLGIEIAEVFYNVKAIEDILKSRNYDFVIASLHKLNYETFNYYDVEDYSKFSPEKLHEYNLKYFEEMIELVKWGDFDVLGHFNLFMRYTKNNGNVNVDLKRYREPIDEILKLVVQNGKGIEINTSGLRNALEDTLPPQWVVSRYRELGGEICTIGSDGHAAEDLGEGIEYGMELLSRVGFEYFAFYRERKPIMLRII